MDKAVSPAAVHLPQTRVVSPAAGRRAGLRLPVSRKVPQDRQVRILGVLKEHQQDQREAEREKSRKLLALRDEYRGAYEQLVSADTRRLLMRIGARLEGRGPASRAGEIGPETRARQREENWRKRLAFRDMAHELRVDTEAIGRLQARFRERFDLVMHPDFPGRVSTTEPLHHDGTDHAAFPVVMGLHVPPYDGSDWLATSWTSGDMWAQDSHGGTPPGEPGPDTDFGTGEAGSWVEMGDGNASDCDAGFAACRSGMLLWYTPALTGPILVSATLRCIETGWAITATDEWGFSDASIWATGAVTLGVYAEAGYEVSAADLYRWHWWGTPASGWPDYFNTDVPTPDPVSTAGGHQFAPGEEFAPGVVSLPGVYMADVPVLIHVGVEHAASMVLNDVSASVRSAGEWTVESISIGQDANQ